MHSDKGIKSFRELLVWQKGIDLTKAIYLLTQAFPNEEKFGLISQPRRAAVSVPCNVAEGQVRRGSAEFAQFLSISLGSLAELKTQLIIVRGLKMAPELKIAPLIAQIHELQKMLHALRQLLKNPGFGESGEWLVMSDELENIPSMPLSYSARHLSLITRHYE